MLKEKEYHQKLMNLADQYLRKMDDSIDEHQLELYLSQPPGDSSTTKGIYHQLIQSVSNTSYQGIPFKMIGKHDGLSQLVELTPEAVLSKYSDDVDRLAVEISKLASREKVTDQFKKFAKSVLSGAKYINTFTPQKFKEFVTHCDNSQYKLSVLKEISKNVFGLSIALSADFLKEIGFVGYPKPDRIIGYMIKALLLVEPDASDADVFTMMCKLSKNVGKTPFYVDKTLYLIGSGRLDDFGCNQVPGRKREFIDLVRKNIGPVILLQTEMFGDENLHPCKKKDIRIAS